MDGQDAREAAEKERLEIGRRANEAETVRRDARRIRRICVDCQESEAEVVAHLGVPVCVVCLARRCVRAGKLGGAGPVRLPLDSLRSLGVAQGGRGGPEREREHAYAGSD